MARPLACGRCGLTLPDPLPNSPDWLPCPSCETPSRTEVFPARHRSTVAGDAGEALREEGEAACFFHAEKRAAASCERCGVFVCKLCDLDLAGEHLCPRCLETGVKKGKLENLQNHRFLYDRVALALALYPLLIFYLTLVTAPVAIFVAIRYWKAPRSLVRPGGVRFVASILFALLELLGWVALIGFLVVAFRKGFPR